QPGPDTEIGAQPLLEVLRAQDAVEPVARPLRDPGRGGVLDVDPELDPLEAELLERPAGEQADGATGDPAAARARADEVADLALRAGCVEAEDAGEPDHLAVGAEDREAGAAPLLPAALVAGDPVGGEPAVGPGRNHGEAE